MGNWILYTEPNLRNAFKEEMKIVDKRPYTIIFGKVNFIYEDGDLKNSEMRQADVLIERASEFDKVRIKLVQEVKPYKFQVIESNNVNS